MEPAKRPRLFGQGMIILYEVHVNACRSEFLGMITLHKESSSITKYVRFNQYDAV
jgi:hypothetical protein